MFPVADSALKTRIIEEILATSLRDDVKARQLRADGRYERVERSEDAPAVRSQLVLQGLARRASRVSGEFGAQPGAAGPLPTDPERAGLGV
jgi:polyphosphate kinase